MQPEKEGDHPDTKQARAGWALAAQLVGRHLEQLEHEPGPTGAAAWCAARSAERSSRSLLHAGQRQAACSAGAATAAARTAVADVRVLRGLVLLAVLLSAGNLVLALLRLVIDVGS